MHTEHSPLISFIVPIYNVEEYLAICIDSILNQEMDKEIILINDGSTDNSLEIALNYATKYPFITLIHSRNEGLSEARNKGMALAKGEYIMFVDSDDSIIGNILPELLSVAKNNQVEIMRIQARSSQYVFPPILDNIPKHSGFITTSEKFFIEYATAEKWYPAVWRNIIKRSFLEENSLKFIKGRLAEDVLFTTQLFTCQLGAKILEFDAFCYGYHIRSSSITFNQDLNHRLKFRKSLEDNITDLETWEQKHLFNLKVKQSIAEVKALQRAFINSL